MACVRRRSTTSGAAKTCTEHCAAIYGAHAFRDRRPWHIKLSNAIALGEEGGPAVLSLSLIRDRECTRAQEHCGRAYVIYGKVERLGPGAVISLPHRIL